MNPGYIPKHLELTSSYVKSDAISFWYVIDHKNGINKQNVIFIKLENTGWNKKLSFTNIRSRPVKIIFHPTFVNISINVNNILDAYVY